MVGKVALFKSQLDGENLAKQLSALYDTWWRQRNEKEKEWRELRNYIFATDTTKTTNSKLPWKNTTTLPKLTQIRDNLHANYMDALFPNDDWLRWEGYSQDDVVEKKRRAIEAYMKNKLRESGFQDTVARMLHDYIDYGNVFGEVEWVEEKHTDYTTGEEITTYVGPKLFRVSPFDIVFNPVAPTFNESPKFVRYLMNIGELQDKLETSGEGSWSREALDKAKQLRKSLSSFKMEDVNKSEGYLIDGFGSLFEYYQSGLVEVLVFTGAFYDESQDVYKKHRQVTIIDRQYIVQDIQDPSWLGQDNKEHTCWRERTDNLYGMGPLDNLVGLQYRLDHLENLKADALDQTILPPKVLIGDVEPFEWGPNADIHVSEDGDVRTLPPNPAAFQVNNEVQYLLQLMEEMAGAPKEAMGIRTPGEKTAFEVQQLQNAAGRIFQNKVAKFEKFLEKLLNKMLEVARRRMKVTDVVKVMDDDVGVADFMEISKDDLTGKGKLRPIGARHYAARAQLIQNVNGVFGSPIGQMIAPHVSSVNMAKMVEEVMGFEKYKIIRQNVAIAEQAQTQRLVNQASATLETEAATPVEENLLG